CAVVHGRHRSRALTVLRIGVRSALTRCEGTPSQRGTVVRDLLVCTVPVPCPSLAVPLARGTHDPPTPEILHSAIRPMYLALETVPPACGALPVRVMCAEATQGAGVDSGHVTMGPVWGGVSAAEAPGTREGSHDAAGQQSQGSPSRAEPGPRQSHACVS